jgi:hypothetical protein
MGVKAVALGLPLHSLLLRAPSVGIAMLAISSATQSIQEDYIRGQDQLILPGAEIIGRRIIGTLVSELGPK